jgi:hypothetical protein
MNLKFSYVIKISVMFLLLLSGCEVEKNVIQREFFGMHIANSTKNSSIITPFHNLGYGSVRFWDTRTNWRHIEPEKGTFNFETLDQMVANAKENNQEILMTLGHPPNWATGGISLSKYGQHYNSIPPENMEDWRNYVKELGQRYKGKIKYYEIWNEPNVKDFFSGSMEDLVTLTKEAKGVLKKIDPEIKIVSPSPTGKSTEFLDEFLKAGGKNYVDIIGVHLYIYPSTPEEMIPLITNYKEVMKSNKVDDLPLWNTEFTWVTYMLDEHEVDSKIMPNVLASSYLARSLLINIGMGLERSFFYGMDYRASKIRLIDLEDPRWLMLPGITYKNLTSWLTGAELIDFTYKDGKYVLTILSTEGKEGIIAWTDELEKKFSLPSGYKDGKYYSVIGEIDKYEDGWILLTNMPVFIYKD